MHYGSSRCKCLTLLRNFVIFKLLICCYTTWSGIGFDVLTCKLKSPSVDSKLVSEDTDWASNGETSALVSASGTVPCTVTLENCVRITLTNNKLQVRFIAQENTERFKECEMQFQYRYNARLSSFNKRTSIQILFSTSCKLTNYFHPQKWYIQKEKKEKRKCLLLPY